MDMNTIMTAEEIKRFRKAKGLTQKELADKAGLSTMSIRRYENAERVAPEKILQKIALALGLPETHFLDDKVPEIKIKNDDGTEIIIPRRIVRRIATSLDMDPYFFTGELLRDEISIRKALNRVGGKQYQEYNNKKSGEAEFGDELAEAETILRKLLEKSSNCWEEPSVIDKRFQTVRDIFYSLNDAGKEKIVEYVEMLRYVPDYQQQKES